jgi:uncharacterized membrane protein YhhN
VTGWVVALSIGAALAAALTIRANYVGPRWHIYVFKPLATLLILGIALLPPSTNSLYGVPIILGLCLSLLGDVWLMLPADRFIAGLVSFLLAHIAYGLGFAWHAGPRISIVWFVPYALYGFGVYRILNPHLGRLRLAVVGYFIAILVMAGLATNVNGIVAVGALLFVISDSVLAYEKFVEAFRSARWVALSTYWAAQWLIALSVWMG